MSMAHSEDLMLASLYIWSAGIVDQAIKRCINLTYLYDNDILELKYAHKIYYYLKINL